MVCRMPPSDFDPAPERDTRLYELLWVELDGINGSHASAYVVVQHESEIALMAECRVATWEGAEKEGKMLWGTPAI